MTVGVNLRIYIMEYFFGNRLAYIVKNPNERFLKDLRDMNIQPQSTSYLYANNTNNSEIIISR